nr:DUF547 domain-containing protein [uncultured Hyphomonas sp.]
MSRLPALCHGFNLPDPEPANAMPAKARRLALPVAILLTPLSALAQPAMPGASAASCAVQQPAEKPDHAAWTCLLTKYVQPGTDGINRVDYAAFKHNAADRATLDAYIAGFAGMDLSGTDADTFAAWANLYNAVTVRYILEKYPTGSIRDGYLFGGPWKKIKVNAGGQTVSLDEIEHGILRPRFHTPLVHYAINCAALSCPNLQTKAWQGATLDEDLAVAARTYINDPRGVTPTPRGLKVSSIYDWFEADFGGSKRAVIDHLLKYADVGLAEEIRSNPHIRTYDYDWSLNDSQKAGTE